MRKKPSGADLLAIAEATEKTARPDDPAANYTAAMIRNARAIAARQAESGAPKTPADDPRHLARAIRAGTAPAGTHACLLAEVRARVAESNPRYLEKTDAQD